ncbi:hypothetical protein JL720_7668 [Aureococcus anophagefferens]|nr:hypothetical protein JL720_7668 [Aureococcus anophagefferens]
MWKTSAWVQAAKGYEAKIVESVIYLSEVWAALVVMSFYRPRASKIVVPPPDHLMRPPDMRSKPAAPPPTRASAPRFRSAGAMRMAPKQPSVPGSIASQPSMDESSGGSNEASTPRARASAQFPTRPRSAPARRPKKPHREPGVGLNLPRDGARGYGGKGGKTPTKGQVRDWLIDLLADAEKATVDEIAKERDEGDGGGDAARGHGPDGADGGVGAPRPRRRGPAPLHAELVALARVLDAETNDKAKGERVELLEAQLADARAALRNATMRRESAEAARTLAEANQKKAEAKATACGVATERAEQRVEQMRVASDKAYEMLAAHDTLVSQKEAFLYWRMMAYKTGIAHWQAIHAATASDLATAGKDRADVASENDALKGEIAALHLDLAKLRKELHEAHELLRSFRVEEPRQRRSVVSTLTNAYRDGPRRFSLPDPEDILKLQELVTVEESEASSHSTRDSRTLTTAHQAFAAALHHPHAAPHDRAAPPPHAAPLHDVDPSRFADVPSPVASVQHEGSKTFPADENENPTIRPPEVRVSPKGKFAKKQKPQLRKQLTAPGPMNRGTVSGSSLL